MRSPEIRSFSKAKGPAKKIIVDLFAGGGGFSLGVEMALGRSPDVAVNHDPEALAMYKANHPDTEHYQEDIYDVDPVAVCKGKPVGLLVMSPDCTEHSRAKNGSIVRSKKIRSLARVAIDWARLVRPDVIILENVTEWLDWGPLDENGKIDPERKGEYRILWWERLEALGYRLSKRILKACDYGAPTSRTRLFIIARCDGVDPEESWPAPTHGPGPGLEPYRTAAECIDYSLPCPSIFMTRRQARAFTRATGIRCKRPLADKTMRRIRRGLWKYVLKCKKPFTIRLTGDDPRTYDIDEPVRTVTAAPRGEFGFVAPIIARYNGEAAGGGLDRAQRVDDPLGTVTTANRFAVVAPYLAQTAYGEGKGKTQRRGTGAHDPMAPLPTVTSSSTGFAVVAPTLIQTGYGERPGQAPRCLDLHAPLGTIIAGGAGSGNGKHALVQSQLERCAAWIYKGFGDNRSGGFAGGASIERPLGSVTTRDHHQLAISSMLKLRGTSDAHMDASSTAATDPVPTISAGGNHVAEVRAFLTKYYGEGVGSDLGDPMHTITTRDRFGIVAVEGVDYQIVDIGMRMLEPRELYNAQGFPRSYIIDPVCTTTKLVRGKMKTVTARLNKTQQVEKCGNSVAPPIAAAIIGAVFTAEAKLAMAA